jgi:hypothetical protein
MKKIICLVLCIIAFSLTSCVDKKRDKQLFEQLYTFQEQLCDDVFELYPTKNMWTFLKLNTITGQIWIVQWSTDSERRFTYTLDDTPRISENDKMQTGRFSLVETDNMYTFIMLDNITGQCYQVQWSFDDDERLVVPIPWD